MERRKSDGTGNGTGDRKTSILYVEISPGEHRVLRVEAAVTGRKMAEIVRSQLIAPLKEKHKMLLDGIGDEKRSRN